MAVRRFNFLICSERSGSNFLTALVDGHPEVSGPPPTHLFRLFGTNRANYGDLSRDDNWRTLLEDMVTCFKAKLGIWHTEVSAAQLAETAPARTVAALLRVIYEAEAAHDGASQVFVKENHTYQFVPFLMASFPACRFVIHVRDPRDVASSWVSTESIPGGVERAVTTWLADQAAAFAVYQQLRDTGRALITRYEDLVTDTEAALRRLVAFMELPYTPVMLDFNQQGRTETNAERIEAWANLRKPVMTGNTGKYKNVLTQEDQLFVELSSYELMSCFGSLAADTLATELDRLRPLLNPGNHVIRSEDENEIRRQRLDTIERVLNRRLPG
jgi:hypothetical protein